MQAISMANDKIHIYHGLFFDLMIPSFKKKNVV